MILFQTFSTPYDQHYQPFTGGKPYGDYIHVYPYDAILYIRANRTPQTMHGECDLLQALREFSRLKDEV